MSAAGPLGIAEPSMKQPEFGRNGVAVPIVPPPFETYMLVVPSASPSTLTTMDSSTITARMPISPKPDPQRAVEFGAIAQEAGADVFVVQSTVSTVR